MIARPDRADELARLQVIVHQMLPAERNPLPKHGRLDRIQRVGKDEVLRQLGRRDLVALEIFPPTDA
ncbi:hypothetical protein D3C72_2199740 [compost metagenome]